MAKAAGAPSSFAVYYARDAKVGLTAGHPQHGHPAHSEPHRSARRALICDLLVGHWLRKAGPTRPPHIALERRNYAG